MGKTIRERRSENRRKNNNKEPIQEPIKKKTGLKGKARRGLSVLLAFTLTLSLISGACNFNSIRSDASRLMDGTSASTLQEESVDASDVSVDSSGIELSENSEDGNDTLMAQAIQNSGDDADELATTEDVSDQTLTASDDASVQSALEDASSDSEDQTSSYNTAQSSSKSVGDVDDAIEKDSIDTMALGDIDDLDSEDDYDDSEDYEDYDSEDDEDSSEEEAEEATTEAAEEATTEAAEEATTEVSEEATTEAAEEASTETADEATTEEAPEIATTENLEESEEATTELSDTTDQVLADTATHQHNEISNFASAKGTIVISSSAVSTYDSAGIPYTKTINNTDTEINLYLTEDTEIRQGASINFKLNICLNGHKLTISNYILRIEHQGEVHFYDCQHDKQTGYFEGGIENYGTFKATKCSLNTYENITLIYAKEDSSSSFDGCDIDADGAYSLLVDDSTYEHSANFVLKNTTVKNLESICRNNGNDNAAGYVSLSFENSSISLTNTETDRALRCVNQNVYLHMDNSSIEGVNGRFTNAVSNLYMENGSSISGSGSADFIVATSSISITMDNATIDMGSTARRFINGETQHVYLTMNDSTLTSGKPASLIYSADCDVILNGENTFSEGAVLYGGKEGLILSGTGSAANLNCLIKPEKGSGEISLYLEKDSDVSFPDAECVISTNLGGDIYMEGSGLIRAEAGALVKLSGDITSNINFAMRGKNKSDFDASHLKEIILVDNSSGSSDSMTINLEADGFAISGPTTVLQFNEKAKGASLVTLNVNNAEYTDLVMVDLPEKAPSDSKAVVNFDTVKENTYDGISFNNHTSNNKNIEIHYKQRDEDDNILSYDGKTYEFDLTGTNRDDFVKYFKTIKYTGDEKGTTLQYSDDDMSFEGVSFIDEGNGTALKVGEKATATLQSCPIEYGASAGDKSGSGSCIVNEGTCEFKACAMTIHPNAGTGVCLLNKGNATLENVKDEKNTTVGKKPAITVNHDQNVIVSESGSLTLGGITQIVIGDTDEAFSDGDIKNSVIKVTGGEFTYDPKGKWDDNEIFTTNKKKSVETDTAYIEICKDAKAVIGHGANFYSDDSDKNSGYDNRSIFNLKGGTISLKNANNQTLLYLHYNYRYFIHVTGEDASCIDGNNGDFDLSVDWIRALIAVTDGGNLVFKNCKIDGDNFDSSAQSYYDVSSILLIGESGQVTLDNTEITGNGFQTYGEETRENVNKYISGAIVIKKDKNSTGQLTLKNGTKVQDNHGYAYPETADTDVEKGSAYCNMSKNIVYDNLTSNPITLDSSFSGTVSILNHGYDTVQKYSYAHTSHISAIPVNSSTGTVKSDDARISMNKNSDGSKWLENHDGKITAIEVAYGGSFKADQIETESYIDDDYFLKIDSVKLDVGSSVNKSTETTEIKPSGSEVEKVFSNYDDYKWMADGNDIDLDKKADTLIKGNVDYSVSLPVSSSYYKIDTTDDKTKPKISYSSNIDGDNMTVSDWSTSGVTFTYKAGNIKEIDGSLNITDQTSTDRKDSPAIGDNMKITFTSKLSDLTIEKAYVYRLNDDDGTYESSGTVDLTKKTVSGQTQWTGTYTVKAADVGKILVYVVKDEATESEYYNPYLYDGDGAKIIDPDDDSKYLRGISYSAKGKSQVLTQLTPILDSKVDTKEDSETGQVVLNINNRANKPDNTKLPGYIQYYKEVKDGDPEYKIYTATEKENNTNKVTIGSLGEGTYYFRYPAIYQDSEGNFSYNSDDGDLAYDVCKDGDGNPVWLKVVIDDKPTLGVISLDVAHTGADACGISAETATEDYQALDKVTATFTLDDESLSWGTPVNETTVGDYLKLRFYRCDDAGNKEILKGVDAVKDTTGYYCRVTKDAPTASYLLTGKDVDYYIYVEVEPNQSSSKSYQAETMTQSEKTVTKHPTKYEVPDLTPTAPSESGGDDGYISGDFNTVALEYSTDLTNWEKISTKLEKLEGLSENTYYFRTAETDEYLAGEKYVSVEIKGVRESIGTVSVATSHVGTGDCDASKTNDLYQAADKLTASFELAEGLSWGTYSSKDTTKVGSSLKVQWVRYTEKTADNPKGYDVLSTSTITKNNQTSSYVLTKDDVGSKIGVIVLNSDADITHGSTSYNLTSKVVKHNAIATISGIVAVNPTKKDASDGRITGLTDGIEISTDGGKTYHLATEDENYNSTSKSLEGLSDVEIYVRTAETDVYQAGEAQKLKGTDREALGSLTITTKHITSGSCDASSETSTKYMTTDQLTATFDIADSLSWGSLKSDGSTIGTSLDIRWLRYLPGKESDAQEISGAASTLTKSKVTSTYVMTADDIGYIIKAEIKPTSGDSAHTKVEEEITSKVIKHNAIETLSGLTVVSPSKKGASDGMITGITDNIEISTDGGKTYHLATKDANYNSKTKCLEGLSNVEIYARVAGTDVYQAGEATKLSGSSRTALGTLTISTKHVTTGKCNVKSKTPPDYMVTDKLTASFEIGENLSWGSLKSDGSTIGTSLKLTWLRYLPNHEDDAEEISGTSTNLTKKSLTSSYVMTADDVGYKIKAVLSPSDDDSLHTSIKAVISSKVIKHIQPASPADLTVTKTSSSSSKDGSISGGVKKYEFRVTTTNSKGKKTTTKWIKATKMSSYDSTSDSLEGLAPGTYQYRYTETDTHQTGSVIKTVKVKKGNLLSSLFKGNESKSSTSTSTGTAKSSGRSTTATTQKTTATTATSSSTQTSGSDSSTEGTNDYSDDYSLNNSVYLNSTIVSDANDLYSAVLSTADQESLASGEKINILLTSSDMINNVTSSDKKALEDTLKNGKLGAALDLNLYKQSGSNYTQVSSTASDIKIRIRVPASLLNWDSTKQRTFYIVRIHNGNSSLIEGTYDAYTRSLVFSTDQFSTYMLAYTDANINLSPAEQAWHLLNSRSVLAVSCLLSMALVILLIYDRRRRSIQDMDQE